MRLIDADALIEQLYDGMSNDVGIDSNTVTAKLLAGLFIDILKQQPTVEPDTTTHDSIPVEIGKNDEDRTSGDCISRHGAIDHLRSIIDATDTKDRYNEGFADGLEFCISHMATMPSAQPEHMHTVMLKIAEKYEKAMNTPYILNPMAWALYQTWKEYDR